MDEKTCGDCLNAEICSRDKNLLQFDRANIAYCNSFIDRQKHEDITDLQLEQQGGII